MPEGLSVDIAKIGGLMYITQMGIGVPQRK